VSGIRKTFLLEEVHEKRTARMGLDAERMLERVDGDGRVVGKIA
jgi:hypothetical protein